MLWCAVFACVPLLAAVLLAREAGLVAPLDTEEERPCDVRVFFDDEARQQLLRAAGPLVQTIPGAVPLVVASTHHQACVADNFVSNARRLADTGPGFPPLLFISFDEGMHELCLRMSEQLRLRESALAVFCAPLTTLVRDDWASGCLFDRTVWAKIAILNETLQIFPRVYMSDTDVIFLKDPVGDRTWGCGHVAPETMWFGSEPATTETGPNFDIVDGPNTGTICVSRANLADIELWSSHRQEDLQKHEQTILYDLYLHGAINISLFPPDVIVQCARWNDDSSTLGVHYNCLSGHYEETRNDPKIFFMSSHGCWRPEFLEQCRA